MKTIIIILAIFCFAISATGSAPSALIDTDGPAQGVVTLDLQELWRAGGEDGEIFFGRVTDVIRYANGEIFVLDNQLCQVEVFGPNGDHLRTLSQQGDGPGDVRQPMGLAILADDLLGIGAGFPGKMVTMTLEGTPVATRYPIGEPAEGNIGVMISLDSGGGILAATGGRLAFDTPTTSYTERFLAVSDTDGETFNRILERQTPMDPTGRLWDEAADYYFDSRWDIGPDGLIYVPMEMDAYMVSVYNRTGVLQFAFGRDQKPHKRTDEDKRQANPIINVTGLRNDDEWDICDYDPSISRIMVNPDDGTIWVLTPYGSNDQPDGVLETWDVFGPTGEFLRQAAIPLGNEIQDGTCYLLGDNIMAVIRGAGGAIIDDADQIEDAEVEPLEVICYQIQ